mmetsp:Transcript_21086/g.40863  ORF Transcript_21086/g.40863 Transcript_21086/m.40863 type:complete len:205 (+) Transcript_21086:144-758(+)
MQARRGFQRGQGDHRQRIRRRECDSERRKRQGKRRHPRAVPPPPLPLGALVAVAREQPDAQARAEDVDGGHQDGVLGHALVRVAVVVGRVELRQAERAHELRGEHDVEGDEAVGHGDEELVARRLEVLRGDLHDGHGDHDLGDVLDEVLGAVDAHDGEPWLANFSVDGEQPQEVEHGDEAGGPHLRNPPVVVEQVPFEDRDAPT